MRPLSVHDILDVWEQGVGQPSFRQALLLLAAACPDTPMEVLSQLPIGQRDARLLQLREWACGPQLMSVATCPNCGERLELSFTTTDIRVTGSGGTSGEEGRDEDLSLAPTIEAGAPLSLSMDGYEISFRLPNSLDLAGLAAQVKPQDGECSDVAASRLWLLERCVIAVRQDGQEKSIHQCPPAVLEASVERMAQADPQADVQLALVCPACAHEWQAAFDIVSFFWGEINVRAQRLLREVHVLASAYGWREADILALSPLRRQSYLQMVNA